MFSLVLFVLFPSVPFLYLLLCLCGCPLFIFQYEKVRWGTPEYRAQHSNTAYYPAPFGRLHSGLSRPSARMAQVTRNLESCR